MKRLTPPCGKVCELRTAECKLTCCKWKKYEAEQAEYRRVREQELAKGEAYVDYTKDRRTRDLHSLHTRKRR